MTMSIFFSQFSSEVIPFAVCSKNKNTRYVVDEIDITETNDGYELSIYGTPQNMIVCGHIKVVVSTLGTTVYRKKVDFCDYSECPLAANEPSMISVTLNQTLPFGFYHIMVRMDTDCNHCLHHCGLGCVEFDYTIS
jgi:hypothetical protein